VTGSAIVDAETVIVRKFRERENALWAKRNVDVDAIGKVRRERVAKAEEDHAAAFKAISAKLDLDVLHLDEEMNAEIAKVREAKK
jgi:hypothetical protein